MKEYPDNFGPSYEEEVTTTKLKFSHIFSEGSTADFIAGAFIEEELVRICGFIAETMQKLKHRGHITQMYVSNRYSNMGIGNNLLQYVLKLAFTNTPIEQITLTVVETNKRAIALYQKNGFKQYGILENCIHNENGYVADVFMVLEIADYLGHGVVVRT